MEPWKYATLHPQPTLRRFCADMANTFMRLALQTEKDLKAQLKKDRPLFDDVEHLILQ